MWKPQLTIEEDMKIGLLILPDVWVYQCTYQINKRHIIIITSNLMMPIVSLTVSYIMTDKKKHKILCQGSINPKYY